MPSHDDVDAVVAKAIVAGGKANLGPSMISASYMAASSKISTAMSSNRTGRTWKKRL
jgi:hypothetical protein